MIACCIEVVFYGERGEFAAEPFARLHPYGGPGDALCAGLVAGESAKFIQMREDRVCVDHASRSMGACEVVKQVSLCR